MALELTDANFDELVLKSDKPVLVDFWAEWCGPCRMVGPVVEELAKDYSGKAVVGKVNVDTNPNISMNYGIRNIPTLLVFKNGQIVDKQVGAVQKVSIAQEGQIGCTTLRCVNDRCLQISNEFSFKICTSFTFKTYTFNPCQSTTPKYNSSHIWSSSPARW